MSNVTPEMVKSLRERTGAGMMDCKGALIEAGGDADAAIEILRKKGISTAVKKAGRVAADGLIGSWIGDDSKSAALIEVNCETDFVTKTEDFRNFVNEVTGVVRRERPRDLASLLATKMGGATVAEAQTALLAKIGENLGVRRFSFVEAASGQRLAQYIHAGSKIGVIALYDDPAGKLDQTTAREVAMHIAAMHPQYTNRGEVPAEVLAKEKEIMLAQMGELKKPPEVLEKIVTGKMGKFYSEVCLEDQLYVRDPDGKASVGAWLKKMDGSIRVKSFVRMQVGEGMGEKQ